MNVLITGGTGSLGQVLTASLLERGDDVTIYSRDELKQWGMGHRFPRARYVLGDVRDPVRLAESCEGMDRIIHAAALKHAPAIEGCPDEAVRTNVVGTMNVIRAAPVGCRIMGISSDKACAPITAYGASKLLMERLLVASGHSAVRLGNIAGSTGSIIDYWRELAAQGKPLPLTDARMTRHWMLPSNAAAFVLRCMRQPLKCCVFVPETRGFRVVDLWRLSGGNGETAVGKRPGEKLHESMIAADELDDAYKLDGGGFYIQRKLKPWLWDDCRVPPDLDTSSSACLMAADELGRLLEVV